MKVYVLIAFTDYENTTVKKVVDTLDKAKAWVKNEMEKLMAKNGGLCIPLPTGLKLSDQGFYYEEWEVT